MIRKQVDNTQFIADNDECEKRATNDCKENQVCKNVPGTFSCPCAPGYALSEGTCEKGKYSNNNNNNKD